MEKNGDKSFFHSIIMFRFGNIKVAKEEFMGQKSQ